MTGRRSWCRPQKRARPPIRLRRWPALGHPGTLLGGELVGAKPTFRCRPRPAPQPLPRRREVDLPARPGLPTPARARSARGLRRRPRAPRPSGEYERYGLFSSVWTGHPLGVGSIGDCRSAAERTPDGQARGDGRANNGAPGANRRPLRSPAFGKRIRSGKPVRKRRSAQIRGGRSITRGWRCHLEPGCEGNAASPIQGRI